MSEFNCSLFRNQMSKLLEIIALISCSVYFGSTLYVTLVEHPARLACCAEVAWAQWVQSVKRTPRYAASALVAAAAALIHSRASFRSQWTWGSVFLLALLPFTVVWLFPIQRRLTEPGWPFEAIEARAKLEEWGRRHSIRALLGACAFALFLWAALKPQ